MVLAILGVLGIVVLTAGTAMFVAAEFGLVAADRAELRRLSAAGDRRAARALRSSEDLSFQLSAAQLGITLTTLAVGFLSEPAVTGLLEPVLRRAGLPEAALESIAVLSGLVLATLLQMIFGELVPKNWAIARPTAVARRVAGPMWIFTRALGPVIRACDGLANRVVRTFGMQPQEELRSARSAAELDSLVRSSAEAGTLSAPVATLLARSLDFGEKTAGAVMTARTRTTALDAGASVAEVLVTARTSGYSRLPLVAAGEDEMARVVRIERALSVPADRRADTAAMSIADPLPRVPESLRLEPLLRVVRAASSRMAAVVDEWGGAAGIVTLGDIAAELVGDLHDEHDERAEHPPGVVPGTLRLDEAADAVEGFRAPPGPYDTLGGLVLRRLGRLARPGDRVRVEGWAITVESVDGRRVETVRIEAVHNEAVHNERVRPDDTHDTDGADDSRATHDSRATDDGTAS